MSDPAPTRSAPTPAWMAAVAGVVAALAALAAGWLLAGVVPGAPSPVTAVGSAVIDLAPPGSKEFVVALFGASNKAVLNLVVLGAVLLAGAGIGLIARGGIARGALAVTLLVGVGSIAAFRDPTAMPALVAMTAIIQAGTGVVVLVVLLDRARPPAAAATDPALVSTGRRRFLTGAGAIGLLAVVGGVVGRQLDEGSAEATASSAAASVAIPDSVDPAPSPAPDSTLAVAGITPLVTPNSEFYKIDTALVTPAVDVATWRLRVHGMVEREVTLTFDELVELPLADRYVTIACVSNEVGGNLVGNAKWTGARLTDVLDMAGVLPGATQIVARSVDGWTAGFPTAWVTEPDRPRDALIAVRMNDEPLPAAHGFPARLIVPGLYGYVSATKWLGELELTTLEAFDAYWVPRGWAKEAPILTQSRIDVPRDGASVGPGTVQVAGVAWAPDRGVRAVEVRVDDGAWQPAVLATPIGPQTWVQWRFAWQATPGTHNLAVRATDGTGEVQTAEETPPAPDGARGHHAILVRVS